MKLASFFCAVGLMVATALPTFGSVIFTVSPGSNNGSGTFTVTSFTSPVDASNGAAATVNLAASVTALHNPIDVTFNIASGLTPSGGSFVTDNAYRFNITITNNTLIPHPISNVQFILDSFNLAFGTTGGAAINPSFSSTPAPTSTYNTPNVIQPTVLWFGGVAGGGGQIAPGGTGTLSFTVNLPAIDGTNFGSGSFRLRMIPNPEPTSMALAGLGIGLVGVGGWLRRRKKSVKAAE